MHAPVNADITHRINLLHDSIARTILISQEAITRSDELLSQLGQLKKQCTGRDRPLCETVRLNAFGDNLFVSTLLKLQNDPAIYKLLTLGEQDLNGVTRNLTVELGSARQHMAGLAEHIHRNMSALRESVIEQLGPYAAAADRANRVLTNTVMALIDGIDHAWTVATPWLDGIEEMGNTVWALALTVAIVILLITLLLIGSIGYGCLRTETPQRAGTPFVVAAASMAIASVVLSLFTVCGMLLGGHGEVFVCRSLYDEPDFLVLGKLFDRPGLMYVNDTVADGGIIGRLLRAGSNANEETSDDNIGPIMPSDINATLTYALKRCEQGAASFGIFQLDRLMNVSRIVEYTTYERLVLAIERLNASTNGLCSITDPLQSIFEDMYVIDIDFMAYRAEINLPAPERDVAVFIEQLQHVANQVQDVGTAQRMVTLANRARRLHTSVLQPLEQLRSEIVYHLTALELQRQPWQTQVNRTLLQLKTTHANLKREADGIFGLRTMEFKNR